MDWESKVLKVGAVAVASAVLVRLLVGGLPQKLIAFLTRPETAAFVLYLETGRVVRPSQLPEETAPTVPPQTASPPETAAPTQPPPTESAPAVFSPEDGEAVEVGNFSGYSLDIPALLTQELCWDLTGEEPTVLILHAHGSECYADGGKDYRSLEEAENVVSLGAELAALLEEAGIRVLHDRTLHDQPSYNSAYENARQSAKEYLEEYPSIRLILDLHRDAIDSAGGGQIAKSITVDGVSVAQLMLVVGSDAGGLNHPDWAENMALAVKLHASLEQLCPGICRPISFRTQRFNQDLSQGALIVEVGAAGNSHREAMRAIKYLAEGIQALANGARGA